MTHDDAAAAARRNAARLRAVEYRFGILAATGFYGENIERSEGRPLWVREKKADALARALPEPERAVVGNAFKTLPEEDESMTTAGVVIGMAILLFIFFILTILEDKL